MIPIYTFRRVNGKIVKVEVKMFTKPYLNTLYTKLTDSMNNYFMYEKKIVEKKKKRKK